MSEKIIKTYEKYDDLKELYYYWKHRLKSKKIIRQNIVNQFMNDFKDVYFIIHQNQKFTPLTNSERLNQILTEVKKAINEYEEEVVSIKSKFKIQRHKQEFLDSVEDLIYDRRTEISSFEEFKKKKIPTFKQDDIIELTNIISLKGE